MRKFEFLFIVIITFGLQQIGFTQIATYDIQAAGLVGMQFNGGDNCSGSAEYRQSAPGNIWGFTWTSTNTNTPSSVQIDFFYTVEEGAGPYSTTLNGAADNSINPTANGGCGSFGNTYNMIPANYTPNGVNTFLMNYAPAATIRTIIPHAFFNPPFAQAYARVTVNYSPLSIDLSVFNITEENRKIVLDWIEEEEDSRNEELEIIVQRSQDSKNWADIGMTFENNFVDENPYSGMNYYRLSQVDEKGILDYSIVKSINVKSESLDFTLAPNPAKDKINISFDEDLDQTKTIKISDLTGKEVYYHECNANQIEVDIGSYAKGVYFVQLTSEHLIKSKQLLVK